MCIHMYVQIYIIKKFLLIFSIEIPIYLAGNKWKLFYFCAMEENYDNQKLN